MMLKTFMAKDTKAALEMVRAELGESAVIVSNQKGRDGVILRAAVDEAALAAPAPTTPDTRDASETAAPGLPPFETRYHDALVTRLRSAPRTPAKHGAMPGLSRAGLMTVLRAHRAPEALVPALAQDAEQSALPDPALALARALDARARMAPLDLRQTPSLLLVGPYGAGKSSVAAKLAAHARAVGRKATLIATDLSGAGAIERLKTFAAYLDVPVHIAEDGKELTALMAHARDNETLAIADTAGFDPRDERGWTPFLSHAQSGSEILGVLSSANDAEETAELAHALFRLGANRLVATHFDTARRKGAMVAMACTGIAIAGVSRSPFLADGLEPMTPLGLAREVFRSAPALLAPGATL